LCGVEHDEITHEQIVAAEMRKPLDARESDPFPDLLGNRTVIFGTRWHKGGVFLSDEAAARCATPEELNREEVRLEAELLRHVKAGLRTAGLPAPEWANGMPPAPESEKRAGRPCKVDGRKGRKLPKGMTAEQRLARSANAARARAQKAAQKTAEASRLAIP
jgi:hypothetical protein